MKESLLHLIVKETAMGTVYAEITLQNSADWVNAKEGLIKDEDVRSVTVNAVVDTDAMSLCITEQLFQKLGLSTKKEREVRVANGQRVICKVTDPVEIWWKDRYTAVPAVVIPGAEIVLLGAIPLEDLDLMVNPVTQELAGVHGDSWESMALCISYT